MFNTPVKFRFAQSFQRRIPFVFAFLSSHNLLKVQIAILEQVPGRFQLSVDTNKVLLQSSQSTLNGCVVLGCTKKGINSGLITISGSNIILGLLYLVRLNCMQVILL